MASERFKQSDLFFFLILLLLVFALFYLNARLGGSIKNPRNLAKQLRASSPEDLPDWPAQTRVPMKYRALFRWIVKGTWSALFPDSGISGFYRVYLSFSMLFFFATLVALYYYLRVLDFSKSASFTGCLLFLASPPVTLAYLWPVHTKEAPLAYFLVIMGMIAVLKAKPALVILTSVLAGLTRETTLIVPFVYLFFAKGPLRKKLLVCLPSVLSVIGVRILLGYETYNPFLGAHRNIDYPVETVIAVFLIFGILWLPGLAKFRDMWKQRSCLTDTWKIVVTSAPVCFAFIIGTHILLARAREIRISFLYFPWIIPLALSWFWTNVSRIKPLLQKWSYWSYTAIVFLVLLSLAVYFIGHAHLDLAQRLGAFCLNRWIIISSIHLFVTAVVILPIIKCKQPN